MNHLAFENPLAWAIGLPAAAAILVLFAWRMSVRGLSRRRISQLSVLRIGAMAILLLLVSRPVWQAVEEELPDRTHVALLIDRSASMSLEEEGHTRYQQAVAFARRDLLPALKQADLQVKPLLFAEDAEPADGERIAREKADGAGTNLGRAILRAAAQADPPPLAVVALSDGAATERGDNSRAVASLVASRTPFLGVGFGTEGGAKVLSLERLAAPTAVSPNQRFRIAAQLTATGQATLPSFELVLLRNGQFVDRKTIAAMEAQRMWQESFQVSESSEGIHNYTVQLLPPPTPTLKCSNTTAAVTVRVADERQLRVLFLQGGLTWNYKFIRLALKGDPAIQFSGLSRTAKAATFLQNVENNIDLAGGFPSNIETLAKFRVVVLSNLKPPDFSPSQQQMLAEFCGKFGGGVLMIGGPNTFHGSWKDSRLEELLPVRFAGSPDRSLASGDFRIQPTDIALRLPAFQITDAENVREAWRRLPGFAGFAAVDSVKPGAEIWMEHSHPVDPGRPPVLMAAQRYGAGMSAVVCVQNLWRWRLGRGSNTDHFDRFWRQLLRHLAEGARDNLMLSLPDQLLEPNVDIRVLLEKKPDPAAAERQPREYVFRVVDQDGRVVASQSVRLSAGRPAEVTFRGSKTGVYTAAVVDQRGAVHASRSIEIRSVSREFLNASRNMDSLNQWARVSDGIALRSEDCADADELAARIKKSIDRQQRSEPRRMPTAVNGWILMLLLGCVCGEWILRKRWGLT